MAIVHDAYAATGIEINGHEPEISNAVHQLGAHRAFLYRINDRTLIGVKPFLDWGGAFTTREIVPSKVGYCSMAFSSLGILSDGTVTLCCADYDGDTSLGNINDRPLIAILSSDRVEAIHRGLSHFRLIEPRCQVCFGGPTLFRSLFKTVVQTGVSKILKPVPGKKVKEVRPL
jgi:radical SAM protein with 4Fe4S-binding SPASM domain